MSRKGAGVRTELDLDSLQLLIGSSDEDDDDETHRRAVEEILNESSSSSSSSLSSSDYDDAVTADDEFNPIQDSEIYSPSSEDVASPSRISSEDAIKRHVSDEIKLADLRIRHPMQWRSEDLHNTSFLLSRVSSRPLPSLFNGVKQNPKPGAALAAAAAASRSIPTPHAAAIKSSRILRSRTPPDASMMKVDETNSVSGLEIENEENADNVNISVMHIESSSVENEYCEIPDNNNIGNSEKNPEAEEDKPGNVEVSQPDSTILNFSIDQVPESLHSLDVHLDSEYFLNSICSENDTIVKQEIISLVEESSSFSLSSSSVEPQEPLPSTSSEFKEVNLNTSSVENEAASSVSELNVGSEVVENTCEERLNVGREATSSVSEGSEVVENELVHPYHKRTNKVIVKKSPTSSSSTKPFEIAEELEKKYASSGLHWEEGAAAQPMRLEGIKRGPPAVGYLQVDTDNVISRNISQAFRREHGSPQVLAVHMNFIAIGMSRGGVVVVPSKYSLHSADNMDAKMIVLGSYGEKSQAPVTSMCFNQQGDLLLVGYGDGHVTFWDPQRSAALKTITGEHSAPVVHTFFLESDSQVTRQFKAVTGDCKGLVLLHTISVLLLLNLFSIKSQCLLDGQRTGIVLSASPLLLDDAFIGSISSSQGSTTVSSGSLGSRMGGVVGGVVSGDSGWKLFTEGSSVVEEGVVIFVTYQTALVVRLSPNLEIYAQLSKPDGVREGSMPYTAWKCSTHVRSSSSDNVPPEGFDKASLLAIAWDRKVQVARLMKSELKVFGEWTLDSTAIGLAWLGDQMLVVLTSRGQLCLFSSEGNEVYRTSLSINGLGGDDFITYHTFFTNIFGNPEKSYHNSLAVRGGTIYILGPMHLIVSRLLPWKERIQVLQKAGDWMGALDMAMRLYDGHAHGVIDLPRELDAIRNTIMQYLIELLLSYVDEVFSYISVAFCNQNERVGQGYNTSKGSGSFSTEVEEQYARVGGVAVEFCVHIKRTDILFDDIFSKFVAVKHEGTFLELLEPYILKDMLGFLPPEIMQELVKHYSRKGWLQRVEQCVLHMDISSLDFNQVARLCREHGLYGALIYLFNRGLHDFRAPLEELLIVAQNSDEVKATSIGYRILVYLKYCFSGLSFPPGRGTLPPSQLTEIRSELLKFLLEESNALNPKALGVKTSIGPWPNLCYLLWLDTEATLDVLKCAFLDDKISQENDVSVLENDVGNERRNPINEIGLVQNTVDILAQILDIEISQDVGVCSFDDKVSSEIWPSKKDVHHLLEYIAFFVVYKHVSVSKCLLNKILEYLILGDISSLNVSHKKDKCETSKQQEKKVLSLLKVAPETDWDPSSLLHICEKAGFYQVCGFIHKNKNDYKAALDSYIKESDEPVHAFAFIHCVLPQLSGIASSTFQTEVISRISELVNLSREGAFLLVIDHFMEETRRILSELECHPRSLFLYLKTVIEVDLSGTIDISSLRYNNFDLRNGEGAMKNSNEVHIYIERVSNYPKLLHHNSISVTDEMRELYLRLMCQYEPGSVIKFLERFESYRLEYCLHLCQEYGITDAAAFLLERVGDVSSALSLTVSGLNEKLHILDVALEKKISEIISSSLTYSKRATILLNMEEINIVRDVVHASVALCKRNTQRLDPQESESLWFNLLDIFSEPLRGLYADEKESKGNHNATSHVSKQKGSLRTHWRITKFMEGIHIWQQVFSIFIKEIVEEMIGYVPVSTIMGKLLSENANQEFGHFKPTILGMLGIYGYERRILDSAKSLIEDDMFYTMSLLKKGATHAWAPQNSLCCICGVSFIKDSSGSHVRVFNCGHATHLQCEVGENQPSNTDSPGCPICLPRKGSYQSKNKSVLVETGLVNSFFTGRHAEGTNRARSSTDFDVEKFSKSQQLPRFEFLRNLQSGKTKTQIDNLPLLKLAPPTIYHEKVMKRTSVSFGENSKNPEKTEKSNRSRQLKEVKAKGSSLRLPLKSSMFGTERSTRR